MAAWLELVAEFRAIRNRINAINPDVAKKFRDRWIYHQCNDDETELAVLRGLITEAQDWLGLQQQESA